MVKYISLNGDDWQLTGWWKNQWRMRKSMELGEIQTAAVNPIQATVPGAVQVDLITAGKLPDPNYGLNSNYGEWVNNREWFYEKKFLLSEDTAAEKYILCFDGLDFHGEIHLNGERITDFSGMFKPVTIDVTGKINRNKENHLRVIFYQTPEVDGQLGFSNQIEILKSRFNYVWDWCPRIIPVGIWDNVYLKAYNKAQIKDFYPQAGIDDNMDAGSIDCQLQVESSINANYRIQYNVYHNGRQVLQKNSSMELIAAAQTITEQLSLDEINLWWPTGSGSQPLYQVEVTIISEKGVVCDTVSKNIGFRNIEFKQNPGSSENALPYTLYVNGRRIFMKGVNWVPISPFYGAVSREDYQNYLQRFKDMNCNILRVWGGAIPEKKDFYDICDELGLMVWQEFPQSSSGINNTPPDDPEFLEKLEQVARVYLRRKRHHASHIVWSGGNELMWENHKPVDEGHINIKMLKEVTAAMDPDKFFLPTSASGPRFSATEEDFGKGLHHDVHGPWQYMGNPEHYHYFNGDDSLFRSETGCPGTARLETLVKYSEDYNIWPPDHTNDYWRHRGSWWIQREQLTTLFGEWNNNGNELKQYLDASRFMQAEALRYDIEATRRREPEASGFIIWMGNEPYPNNANTSVIEYDGTPKPAYYWVKNAYAGSGVSAKYDKLNYTPGEKFRAVLYYHGIIDTDNHNTINAQILDIKGNVIKEETYSFNIDNYAINIGTINWQVNRVAHDIFFLRLQTQNKNNSHAVNTYTFTTAADKALKPLKELPQSHLDLTRKNGDYLLTNISQIAAAGIFIYSKNPDKFVDINPGYLFLMPGEQKKLQITPDVNLEEICIEGFNYQK